MTVLYCILMEARSRIKRVYRFGEDAGDLKGRRVKGIGVGAGDAIK